MGKIKLLGVLLVLAVAGLFASQATAMGLYIASENGDAVIGRDKTVDGSAYLGGNNVVIDGIVDGDVYCAGRDVRIAGTVNGDVICAGQSVTLTGTVNGDIRLAGATVTLSGRVTGSATVAGSSLTTLDGFALGRDMTAAGATISLAGTYGRDMTIGGENVTINGKVGRDVSGSMTTLGFGSQAKVGGNLSYQADTETSIAGGVVTGSVKYSKQQDANKMDTSSTIQSALWGLVIFVVFAVIVTLVMPKFVHEAAMVPGRTVLIAFLAGLATLILGPIVAMLLISSVVGVMAGVVLLIVWLLTMVLSGVFVAYFVGGLVLRKRATNAILVVAVGALVLGIAVALPVIGVIVVIAGICAGVGMQIMQLGHQFSKHPYKITA